MKRLIFVLIFISFSSNAFPQWLVDGGNLIWPYGSVILKNNLELLTTTTSFPRISFVSPYRSSGPYIVYNGDNNKMINFNTPRGFAFRDSANGDRLIIDESNTSLFGPAGYPNAYKIQINTNNALVIGDNFNNPFGSDNIVIGTDMNIGVGIKVDVGNSQIYVGGQDPNVSPSIVYDKTASTIFLGQTNSTNINVDKTNDKITVQGNTLLFKKTSSVLHLDVTDIPTDSTTVLSGELWIDSSGVLKRKF